MKFTGFVAVALVVISGLSSCNKQEEEAGGQPRTPAITQGEVPASAAGISWRVPARWTTGPAKQMRVVTYNLPALTGGTEGGECAVFYFGASEGGDVEANMARWIGQFEPSGEAKRSTQTADGMKVHLIDLSGVYLSGGPMMGAPQQRKEGHRLLGAIVEGPQGSVFFKTTGPGAVIEAAEEDFQSLVESFSRL
jgi:hypothetical protein